MYDGVKSVLGQFGVPLENCVAVAVDNTNANMGAHHSLKTLMTKDNPSVYFSGCVCHILHNAASKGSRKLQVRFHAHNHWMYFVPSYLYTRSIVNK